MEMTRHAPATGRTAAEQMSDTSPDKAGDGNEEQPCFVDNYFLFLLAMASHTISAEFHDYLRQKSVRVSDWRILSCLADREGLMITELAALALLEQPHVTKIVDRLQQEGLVEKRSDDADRRRTRVHITPTGRLFVDGLIADAKAHEARVLSTLTRREQDVIYRILRKLRDRHQSPFHPS